MWGKNKTIEALGVDDWLFVLIGIPALALLFPILFLETDHLTSVNIYFAKAVISLFYTTLYWLSARSLCIYFRLKFPSYRDTRKRLVYYFGAVVVVFAIVQISCSGLHAQFAKLLGHHLPEKDLVVMPFILILLVSAVYESIFLFYRWKNSAIETEKLRRENIQSQLEGLKNQVNPHFLFNSLNTLAYLIPEDSNKAVCFVQKLSKVYRYILEIRDKKLISLSDELDFLQSYIFLLRERFGENISITIDIEEDLNQFHIVPLSLQILFENAIKHNVISKDKNLYIEVFSQGMNLVVKNNLQKKKLTAPSTKVGLQNIKNRYAYFIEREVDVIETKDYFLVSLPLIQPQILKGSLSSIEV